MNKCVYNDTELILHGIFQKSYMIGESYAVGGHKGGQIAFPVAVIELLDGSLMEVHIHEIKIIKNDGGLK